MKNALAKAAELFFGGETLFDWNFNQIWSNFLRTHKFYALNEPRE